MSKTISLAEVKQHNTATDAWIVIDGDVYDISKFLKMHPGGAALLAAYAGTDATEDFFDMHRKDVLAKYQRLKVGRLETADNKKPTVMDQTIPGTLSMVPYAEPAYLQGWKSPIYSDKHKRFRIAVRKWYDEVMRPICVQQGASDKTPSLELFQKMGKAGILAGHLAPSKTLAEVCGKIGISLPGGVAWKDYDLFMEQIVHEEHARLGEPGFCDGLTAGFDIGCPTLIYFGTKQMKEEVLPQVLLGNKRICLAITEPFAGSDVARIKCTAKKTEDGKHYIVNGVKKWITCGVDSDYFVTAVRTGGGGMGGITLLLIERSAGVTTNLIKTSYSASAGTAYVIFENVKVPVENVLHKENKGFQAIMQNFNHERWMIICNITSSSRLVLTECILWANQRKVFGKPLIEQPVIMQKLSEMAAQIEAVTAWLDTVTYQMQYMDYKEQNENLAGPIALLKFYATRVALLCADHGAQIFGGRAITRTGMGQNIERFARAVKYTAIYGGSEEIMANLAAKQMLKRMPVNSRL